MAASIEDIRKRRDAAKAAAEQGSNAVASLHANGAALPSYITNGKHGNSAFCNMTPAVGTHGGQPGGQRGATANDDEIESRRTEGETHDAKNEADGPKATTNEHDTDKEKAASVGAEAADNFDNTISNIMQSVENDSVEAAVAAFNKEHFITQDGRQTCIVREAFDPELKVPVLHYATYESCKLLHADKTVLVGNKVVDLVTAWVRSPQARRYLNGVSLLPEGQVPAGVYNMYRGWGVKPSPGDATLLVDFVREVICSDDPQLFEYMIGWLAYGVQNPGKQAEVATVLRGGRGTGKGFMGSLMCRIFGTHGMHILQQSHLVGNFNAHLRGTLFLFADEAFFAGDRKAGDVLKGLITNDKIAIEAKGVDVRLVRNRIKVMMATNHEWVVPAGEDERRFFVLDVSDIHKQDHAYFGQLSHHIEHGGAEAFLDYLLKLDLSGFNIRKVPTTQALIDQKVRSLPLFEQWLHNLLYEGQLHPTVPWGPIECKTLARDFETFAARRPDGRYINTSQESIGKHLRKCIPSVSRKRLSRPGGERPWAYDFPALEEARKLFVTHVLGGSQIDWPDEVDEGEVEGEPNAASIKEVADILAELGKDDWPEI